MTWRSLICFSLLTAAAMSGATVSGRITLERGKDKRGSADYSGVVVWLTPVNGTAALEVRPRRATMVQKDKTFTPHVLAIPVGSVVDFPNYDPIFHNAFSNFSGQIFDIGLYPPGSTRAVTFRRAGVVRVFCNIHPAMAAVIVVVDTPWYAITGADGTYRIADVPPGVYEMHVFDERATPETLAAVSRKVTIENAEAALPALRISEAGYIPTPHKNKYGKDYPPADEGGVGYRR